MSDVTLLADIAELEDKLRSAKQLMRLAGTSRDEEGDFQKRARGLMSYVATKASTITQKMV